MNNKLLVNADWYFRANEDARLSLGAKCLAVRVFSLARQKGCCWASNKYLAECFSVHPSAITRWLKELHEYKYVKIEAQKWQGNRRKIWPAMPPLCTDADTSVHGYTSSMENCANPLSADAEQNNMNRTIGALDDRLADVSKDETTISENELSEEELFQDSMFLQKLNDCAGRKNGNAESEKEIFEQTMNKILQSSKKLSELTDREQAYVVLAFYKALRRYVVINAELVDRILRRMQEGNSAEDMIRAMWRMQHDEYWRNMEGALTGWDLDRLLEKDGLITKVLNRSKEDLDTQEWERAAVMPFENLLSQSILNYKNADSNLMSRARVAHPKLA